MISWIINGELFSIILYCSLSLLVSTILLMLLMILMIYHKIYGQYLDSFGEHGGPWVHGLWTIPVAVIEAVGLALTDLGRFFWPTLPSEILTWLNNWRGWKDSCKLFGVVFGLFCHGLLFDAEKVVRCWCAPIQDIDPEKGPLSQLSHAHLATNPLAQSPQWQPSSDQRQWVLDVLASHPTSMWCSK